MTFVTTQPHVLAAAAERLSAVGAELAAHNEAATGPIAGVVPPAADEVSALTAAQFVSHAALYQTVSADATAIHQRFVELLGASADSYAATEAANAQSTT